MAKYKVWGNFTGAVSITIEADSEDEAFDKAYAEFQGIGSFVGNGGIDKLIGVYEDNESIDADGAEVHWNEAEKVEE
ncbi:hypothetical protein EHV15_05240 [Paenibacillus oralis]|uniref:Uncharacterized protein n=1 Tax=Paenibacillus oralis TaxID=2490856 RepID=A0A3P3TX60_9BACL|nr:hypothetical protein [Paenibacillus oralis]RRJ62420.1 hypothetical protein EHV15_05240 [Paenibacillus oralis]